jgi:hypothetical protein
MAQETIEHVFKVSSPAYLKLSNISGSVDIQAGEDGVIHIQATKEARSGDQNTTSIEVSQAEDGSVSVATRTKDNDWGWIFGSHVCDVDYTVKAPRQCSLTVNGVSDTVHISGFEGSFNFKNVSGDITLHDLTGELKVDTVSGDVTSNLISGNANLKSVSGDIILKDSKLPSVHVTTVSGDVSLQTEVMRGPYKFNTVSGDVSLEVPASSGCNVELHSLSGDLSTNLPVSQSSRSMGVKTATLLGGGAQISLNSVSGDLSIEFIGEIPQAPVVNSREILSMLEKGELSVDEAVQKLKG